MLSFLGLGIVILAWGYQLFIVAVKKNRRIQPIFTALYAIGVLLLVIDGFMSGMTLLACLNLVSLLCAMLVFLLLMKTR